ncbi:hypothetical protein [Pusillimonas noertemannii]|uniref:Uncharacterized protein n=1 Tax=Pusillimonas noertemannii TaxID=305977 RepID=A0A2U1CRT0_9BURK|nr:hypothetical protein [Pusillimonas noertemannii]NYT67940.1 hypothetical protein [Pusillimonas noertemannii]PVY68612.1 hypothetical protein C7440_1023 [Pusillimonas noertemannii]TFL11918.1 hypothetical protein CSC72_01950 [Pusillimonas noertemannii]
MNEQLQTALAEILARATQGIDAGTQFLSAQLPDVIQQLLVWKAVMSGLLFSLSIAGFIGVTIAIVRVWRNTDFWDGENMPPAALVAFFLCFLYGLPSLAWSLDWLQIWIAPKIYLIEYAASLAK